MTRDNRHFPIAWLRRSRNLNYKRYYFTWGFSSLHPWSHFKLHKDYKRPFYRHLVWGKLSIVIDYDYCGCGFSDECPDCCEHDFDPDSGYMCLNCGKEGAEDVMSAAYDRYKDYMKYGD